MSKYKADPFSLSDKQVLWLIYLGQESIDKKAEVEKVKPEVKSIDLGPVREKFLKVAEGLKRPILRLAHGETRIRVTLGSGKYEGSLWVNTDESFESRKTLGRIRPDGTFEPYNTCSEAVLETLRVASVDVKESVRNYGRITGHCSVCGLKLTDPISIERAIGPICEGRLG
jgi:hypothetical protein